MKGAYNMMSQYVHAVTIGVGNSVIEILSHQYPSMLNEISVDIEYAENPGGKIGSRMVQISKKELQGSVDDAYDAIQDFLAYLCKSEYDFTKPTLKGRPGAETWQVALRHIYGNLRTRSMSASFKKYRQLHISDEDRYSSLLWHRSDAERKGEDFADECESELTDLRFVLLSRGVNVDQIVPSFRRNVLVCRSIDDAFGIKSDSGQKECGEERIPDQGIIAADEVAIRNGLEAAFQVIIPGLRSYLPVDSRGGYPVQRLLFDFIMNEGDSGTFFNDIKVNMNQASKFRRYCERLVARKSADAVAVSGMLERFSTRWSGLVTDTRVKLVKSIREFISQHLATSEYARIWEGHHDRAFDPQRLKAA